MKMRAWFVAGTVACVLFAGRSGFADEPDYTVVYGEGTTTITVAEGKTVDIKDATDGTTPVVTALTGERKSDTLVKNGPGLLILSQDISAFAGAVTIAAGHATVSHKDGLGKTGVTSGTVTIEDGATLMIDSTLYYDEGYVENMTFFKRPLVFGGFGPDGREGVMTSKKGKALYCIFKESRKTMTKDALWNGSDGRIDIRFGTFDMAGHTFHTTNNVGMTSCTIENPGHIVVHKGTLSLESSPKFNGGDTNTITLKSGAGYAWKNGNTPVEWTLKVDEDATFSSSGGGATTNQNCQAGPVVLAAGATLFHTGSGTNTISGPISGAGNLKVGDGVLNLTCPSNTFSGIITQNWGTVNAYHFGSIPNLDADHLKLTGGTFNLLMDADEVATLTEADKWKLFTYNGAASKPVTFNGDYSITRTDGYNLKKTVHPGPGALTLSGAAAEGDNDLGAIHVNGGTLRLDGLGHVDAATYVNYVGAVWPNVARLVIGDGTTYAALPQPTSDPKAGDVTNVTSYVHVGRLASSANNVRGIVEIEDGAVVSNRFNLGYGGWRGSAGSLYMRGGRLAMYYTNWQAAICIGGDNGSGAGSGYMELSGGETQLGGYPNGQWFHVGERGHSAGVISMLGGSVTQGNQGLTVASGGGTGEVHVAGGTFSPGHTTIGGYVHRTTAKGGFAVLNQTGGTIAASGDMYFGGMSNGTAIASFAGGVISLNGFYGVTNQVRLKSGVDIPYTDNKKYVNFNGGTIKRRGNNGKVFRDSFTRFTDFAGGVTLDSSNENGAEGDLGFDYPIEKPTGKGVQAIALPPECQVPWNYIGAPFVWIVDPTGRGYGASAHADFDSTTGVITGITVVAPGCDYGEGTYARLDYGGYTEQIVIPAADVILAESAGGGVRKIGAGTAYLNCANSYEGWTRVEEGTLNVCVVGSYPEGSPLDLAGGDLRVTGGTTLTVSELKGNVGTVNGSVSATVTVKVTDALVVDCAQMTPGGQYVINGVLNLDGAKVKVLNVPTDDRTFRLRSFVKATGGIVGSYTVEGVPDGWHVTAKSDTISFGAATGLIMVVR